MCCLYFIIILIFTHFVLALALQYRSKRRGFHHYVQGQILEIGNKIFKKEIGQITVKLLKQEVLFDTVIVSYELKFDNTAYKGWAERQVMRKEQGLPIKAGILFEMFPFCILFYDDLVVSCIGIALRQVIPGIVGKKVTEYFELIKPLIEFKFDIIMSRSNNMFELATTEEVDKLGNTGSKKKSSAGFDDEINLDDVSIYYRMHTTSRPVFYFHGIHFPIQNSVRPLLYFIKRGLLFEFSKEGLFLERGLILMCYCVFKI